MLVVMDQAVRTICESVICKIVSGFSEILKVIKPYNYIEYDVYLLCLIPYMYSMLMYTCMYACRTIFWPYLSCLAKDGEGMDPKTGERCADKLNMNWQKISTCYQGEEGRK